MLLECGRGHFISHVEICSPVTEAVDSRADTGDLDMTFVSFLKKENFHCGIFTMCIEFSYFLDFLSPTSFKKNEVFDYGWVPKMEIFRKE